MTFSVQMPGKFTMTVNKVNHTEANVGFFAPWLLTKKLFAQKCERNQRTSGSAAFGRKKEFFIF